MKTIVYTSEWLRKERATRNVAEAISKALKELNVEHRELTNTQDIWCRDYMPLHLGNGRYAGYRYNPDYLQNPHDLPYITPQAEALQGVSLQLASNTDLVLDGGNYLRYQDPTSLKEMVFMTDKIFTENARMRPTEVLLELERALEAEVIVLPWDMSEPYGHIDGMLTHLTFDRLLLNNYQQTLSKSDMPFRYRLLRLLDPHANVTELTFDCPKLSDSWCYLNYLRVDNGILLPSLSPDCRSEQDLAAQKAFRALFPDLRIFPIYALPLIKRGGGLHCATWELYVRES